MSRKTTLAAGALAALLASGLSVSVASAAADRNCPSFTYQEDAQEYFESIGGSADVNADDLDENSDGVACENLPKRGSGGAATTTPSTPAAGPDNEDEGDESSDKPAPTDDDDSTADTSGSQVEVVPEGSADTGSA